MAQIIETATGDVAAVDVDVVTLDIIENALRNARYEMDEVLFRTALSPGIREQHDEFPLIGDPEGKMVAGQFGLSVPALLGRYEGTIEEGDVLLTSDPYACDAAISHANDWLVVMPIYHAGRVVGWASMFGHMADVGGKTPSSMPTDARTIFEEGVLIPPFKLYRQGELNEEALKIILNQVRMPEWNRADLNGIVAACRTAGRRVQELCDRFGVETYLSALNALLDRNYRAMKTLLTTIFADGETISFTDYICDDGVGYGPYELKLSLTRTGDKVVLDFTGSSPQAQGPVNYYVNENLVRMFFGIYMITVADPQILWNDGYYPLIDVVIPDASYWKPNYPAALNARNHGVGRIFDLFGGLLGQKNPSLLNAAGFSSSPHFMYSGNYTSPDRKGEWFQLYSIGFGGIPGRPIGDGPDGHSLWPLVRQHSLRVPGVLLPDADRAVGDRRRHRRRRPAPRRQRRRRGLPVPGAGHDRDPRRPLAHLSVGGQRRRAGRARPQVDRAGRRDDARCCRASATTSRSGPGDVLHFVTWGGGGWGDPLERDPALVALEVRRGLVTADGRPPLRRGGRPGRRGGPGGDRGAARGAARPNARPSCRSSTWGRRWPRSSSAAWPRPGCPPRRPVAL